jgi:hydrogenase maturation protease
VTGRTLVAGCGNIFLGDDGFGVEVARRLAESPMPEGIKVADFGIRGVHLAYELLDGYDTAILVDATPRGEAPGTITVLEPEVDSQGRVARARDAQAPLIDAHGMAPHEVLELLAALGGTVGRLLVVGCEPAEVTEHMGLSAPVSAAVDDAVRVIRELVADGSAEEDRSRTPHDDTKGEWTCSDA